MKLKAAFLPVRLVLYGCFTEIIHKIQFGSDPDGLAEKKRLQEEKRQFHLCMIIAAGIECYE